MLWEFDPLDGSYVPPEPDPEPEIELYKHNIPEENILAQDEDIIFFKEGEMYGVVKKKLDDNVEGFNIQGYVDGVRKVGVLASGVRKESPKRIFKIYPIYLSRYDLVFRHEELVYNIN